MKRMTDALALIGMTFFLVLLPAVSSTSADEKTPSLTTSQVLPVDPPATPEREVAAPETPKEPRRVCPDTRYLDCMPHVGESARPMCDPEYVKWIKEHCPGVTVVY